MRDVGWFGGDVVMVVEIGTGIQIREGRRRVRRRGWRGGAGGGKYVV